MSVVLLTLVLSYFYRHRFSTVSQIVPFDNIRTVVVMAYGKNYELTDQQAREVLNKLDELPMSKCRVTATCKPSPPGEQYRLKLAYKDNTRATIVFVSRYYSSCTMDFYTSDGSKKRAMGKISEEYVAFSKFTHETVGLEWKWK